MAKKDEFNQENFDDCKKEFKNFLDIQYPKKDIDEQIEKFCFEFCFDDLYNIEKLDELSNDIDIRNKYIEFSYGSNSKDAWDCDDTHLARVVLFLIHANYPENKYRLPGLNNLTHIGSGYKYRFRGDTLNTYGTLFGNRNQGYVKFFKKNMKIRDFRRKYLTIGNFFLLPALSVQLDENKRKWDSINTFRGINEHYRDFFDLFLYRFLNQHKDFEPWREKSNGVEYLKDYFDIVDNKNEFIERNILKCYFDEQTNELNLFDNANAKSPYYWWDKNINEKDYREFALGYIRKSTEIIDYRAGVISKILQEINK